MLDFRIAVHTVPLPETPMTAEAVLEHLAGTIDFEECVKESLGRLLDLFKQKETIAMNNNSKRLIVLAMDSNMADPDIQIAGCDVLSSLVLSGIQVLVNLPTIGFLNYTLRMFLKSILMSYIWLWKVWQWVVPWWGLIPKRLHCKSIILLSHASPFLSGMKLLSLGDTCWELQQDGIVYRSGYRFSKLC